MDQNPINVPHAIRIKCRVSHVRMGDGEFPRAYQSRPQEELDGVQGCVMYRKALSRDVKPCARQRRWKTGGRWPKTAFLSQELE